MAAPTTVAEFLDLLAQSDVVSPATVHHYRQLAETGVLSGDDPAELARLLVQENVLTRFQAGQLLLGASRRFCIGKYKVLDQIGSGGMAKIYLCVHQHMGHQVAIKVLPPARAKDPSALERFYREARAIAALDHPNIIRATDIDRFGDIHFLVMEYVEGPNLEDVVKRQGPLGAAETIRYLRQAALGLQHAFEAGLIHRDIKPSNLIIDRSGTVKILDLGLARFFRDEKDDLSHRYNEKVLGTADYLAPEQAEEAHKVDIRADIYSLGCTGYFCLTGRPPFTEGSFTQKLIWHQVMEPKPISQQRDDLPAELITVIEKMMAKDPNQRYQTPADVAAALTSVPLGKGSPTSWETATPQRADATRKERTVKLTQRIPIIRQRRRRTHWLMLGSIIVLVALSAALAGLYFGRPANQTVLSTVAATTPAAASPTGQALVPRLRLQCGRGASQEELLLSGFGYKLRQGSPFNNWPTSSPRRHCWMHPQRLRVELRLPPDTPARLRLYFIDGGKKNLKQLLTVEGRPIAEIEDFAGAGREIDVPISEADTQDGRIEIVIDKLDPAAPYVVVSTIELLTP